MRERRVIAEVDADLLRARPDVVALSVTLFKHVVEVRAVVEAIKGDERTRHIPVVVGGRPFVQNPALADLVGARAHVAAITERAMQGELDFALTGVIAGLTAPLAEAQVPVFVISTEPQLVMLTTFGGTKSLTAAVNESLTVRQAMTSLRGS